MRVTTKFLLLLATLFPLYPALASDDSVDLNKIVVTPSRIQEVRENIPYKVDVIGGAELRQEYPEDLGEALDTLTSVNVSDYGGLGASKTVRMRGATGSQVLVMLDGRPLNSPRDGEIDISTIPLSFVDRVEVVHGPGSSLYGSSAMGGIVNVITKNPPAKPQTQVTSLAGNRETIIERLSSGATAGKFGYILNTEYQHSKGFRDNAITDGKSAGGKVTYGLTDNSKLSFNTGYSNFRTGAPGQSTSPDNDDHQLQNKFFADGALAVDAGDGLSFNLRAYRNYDRLRFFENSAGSINDAAGSVARHTTVANGSSAQATKEFGERYTATGGFDYAGNFNDSSSSGKHDYNVRAGYLQNLLSVTEKTRLNFGARVDDYSNFGTKANPNAGIVYSFSETDRIRGAVSSSFRAPTFNDLYWPDEGWARGNPDVRPEKSVNMEAGVDKQVTTAVSTSLTYFHNRFSDLINWMENNGVWMPGNIGSADISGLEVSNTCRLTKKVSLTTGYTYQRPKDRATKKDLIYQPRHKADVGIKYLGKGTVCNLNAEYTGKRFHDTDNKAKVKQLFTLNLSIDHALTPDIGLMLNLNNILNRKYEVIKNYPQPGFSFLAGAKISF